MTIPSQELPREKYADWRRLLSIKRFDVLDDRKALYYMLIRLSHTGARC